MKNVRRFMIALLTAAIVLISFSGFTARAKAAAAPQRTVRNHYDQIVSAHVNVPGEKTRGEGVLGIIEDITNIMYITVGETGNVTDGVYTNYTDKWGNEYRGTIYLLYTDGFSQMNDDDRKMITGIYNEYLLDFTQTCYLNFSNMDNLTWVEIGMQNVDQWDSYGMFEGCVKLESAYLYSMSGLTSTLGMFRNCTSLESVDLSWLDTSKVTNMGYMFFCCRKLPYLDLSDFDTGKVTKYDCMFYNCSSLISLDITCFDTTNVPVADNLFYHNYSMDTIILSNKWGRNWPDRSVLGEGYWTNGNLVKSAEELASGFWTNRSTWAGTWTKILAVDSIEMSTDGITLRWTPVEGATKYTVEEVWGESTTTTKNTYKTFSGMWMNELFPIRVTTTVSDREYSLFVIPEYNPFSDIPYDSEDYITVTWAYNAGIVGGTSKTTYSPDGYCTRAQFCIMLWKMMGKPAVTIPSKLPFSDIASQTTNTKKAIIWCYNQGIISGKNGKFNPKGQIKREQLAIMLYKLAECPDTTNMYNPFSDIGGLTPNTRKAIIWLYNEGLDYGLRSDEFGPKKNGTRSQLTFMLYGYYWLFYTPEDE